MHWRPISAAELDARITTPLRTVLDCARDLPLEESLAVADSALRSRRVDEADLHAAAARAVGPNALRLRRVAELADGRAANPFESRLRLIAHDVPGLAMCPQLQIADGQLFARVDLGDPRLGIVAEADSFEWHGGRAALAADARRYNELVSRDWLVLRFTYEHVFGDPDWVRRQLVDAVGLRSGAQRPLRRGSRDGRVA